MSAHLTWDSTESELRCRIAAWLFDHTRFVPQSTFTKLSDWLQCDQYIHPDRRKLLQIERHIGSATECFHLWNFLDLLECHFTLNEQEMIWKLINES